MEVNAARKKPTKPTDFAAGVEADVKKLLPKGVTFGKPIPSAKFQDTILAILTAFEDAGTPVDLREKARIRGAMPVLGAKLKKEPLPPVSENFIPGADYVVTTSTSKPKVLGTVGFYDGGFNKPKSALVITNAIAALIPAGSRAA